MVKISELTAASTPVDPTDLLELVQDVAGTPVSRKVTVGSLPIGGGEATLDHKLVTTATGNVSINAGGAWANLSTYIATATDVTLSGVAAGDVIGVQITGRWDAQATPAWLDFATIVGGTIVNYISSGTGSPLTEGVQFWQGLTGLYTFPQGVTRYTLQAGDIDGGSVTLRPRVKTNAAKTFQHNPTQITVVNFGAQQA